MVTGVVRKQVSETKPWISPRPAKVRVSTIPAVTSRSGFAPIWSDFSDPRGIVTAWPDIRRPVNVDPSRWQLAWAARSSEIRFSPIPVSKMNFASMPQTWTGSTRQCVL